MVTRRRRTTQRRQAVAGGPASCGATMDGSTARRHGSKGQSPAVVTGVADSSHTGLRRREPRGAVALQQHDVGLSAMPCGWRAVRERPGSAAGRAHDQRLVVGLSADWVAVTEQGTWVAGVDPGLVRYDGTTGRQNGRVALGEVCLPMDRGFSGVWAATCGAAGRRPCRRSGRTRACHRAAAGPGPR